MDLTPDTDPARLSRLAIPARCSAESRRDLKRLANICTPRAVDISVVFTDEEASCRALDTDDDGEESDGDGADDAVDAESNGGADADTSDAATGAGPGTGGSAVPTAAAYEIRLPTERVEQVRTDMHPRRWDRRVQVGLLFHELGHARHSDLERVDAWRATLDPPWSGLFRRLYNAAEDGVVETQLAAEFDLRDDFLVLNDTFAALEQRGHRTFVERFHGPGAPLTYTVAEALELGLLDRGFGDSGRFAAIRAPGDGDHIVRDGRGDVLARLEPVLDAFMTRMLAEPDGTRRADLAAGFLLTIRPLLADLSRAQLGSGQRPTARPQDAATAAVGDPAPADRLPGVDGGGAAVTAGGLPATVDGTTDGVPFGRAQAAATDVTEAMAAPRADEPTADDTDDVINSDGTAVHGRLDEATVRAAAERLRDGDGRRLDEGGTEPLEREARELLDAVREHDAVDRVRVPEPPSGAADRARLTAAERDAAALETALESQLRRERRAQRRGGHRAGRLDSRRVAAVAQGSERVFERVERGGKKDYSCLVLLDRSASMSGAAVAAAERAAARLALAMHGVGVDASVLSVHDGAPRLDIPFGADPREHADRLLAGAVDGSTPLAPALTVARERVADGDGHEPLVFVVTDGEPDDIDAYRSVLAACNFPVFGVYLRADAGAAPDHARHFDRLVVTDPDNVGRTVADLARTLLRRA
jgi:hypothetical protein